jgi:hypothetical protein
MQKEAALMNDSLIASQIALLAKTVKKIDRGYQLTQDENEALEDIISRAPTRSDYKLVEQLTAVIQMLASYPKGLSILLGRITPPSSEQISEMIFSFSPAGGDAGVRVDGGQSAPQAERMIYTEESFNAVVTVCGGWEHIADIAKGYIKMYPNAWGIVMDHARWVRTKITRIDGSSLKKIADIHGISVDAIRNTVISFPRELAEAILASPVNGNFDLRGVDDYPAI